jgi:hypothetical protein
MVFPRFSESFVNLPDLINTALGGARITAEMIREAAAMMLDKGGGGTSFLPNPAAPLAALSRPGRWIDAKQYKRAALG